MILPARIAARYLRAPKAHSAVNTISIISVVGVAVATAAIICVLSVFNGFRSLLAERLDTLAPDILVTPSSGKTFADADSVASLVAHIDGVQTVMPSVTDNALAIFDSREMPVTLRGVDIPLYSRITSLDSLFLPGSPLNTLAAPAASLSEATLSEATLSEPTLSEATLSEATLSEATLSEATLAANAASYISVGVASQLGIANPGEPLLIFAPRREGRVNMANPMASFITDSISIAGIFQAYQSDYDEKTVICDINVARGLFQYDNEATALEIKLNQGADPQKVMEKVAQALGPSAVVKDRLRQQEMNFRMISIEKWVTFLLLIFILIIASFNIISTLCMLILEKKSSLATLSALGMRRSSISAIFRWESAYISAIGGGSGILLGIILVLLQQHFGLIRLAGDPTRMIVTAYPVLLQPADILLALLPLLLITLLTSLITTTYTRHLK